ncbi:MAG: alpha/beta hydrolase [Terracidiphilus sp.]
MSWKKKLLIIAGAVVIAAGVGFWMRPISYYQESLYLRDCLQGVESRNVQVAGHRVYYQARGPAAGPVVVLVHGLSGSTEDWRNLAPWLVKAGFRVYTLDLLGHGRSEKPEDFSYAVYDQAEVVTGFMDALGLKQVDLGGWSMGGGIAQHVALKHPERVRRLILFDSVGVFYKPAWNVRLFTPKTPQEIDELDAVLMPHPTPLPGFVARDALRVSNQRAWIIGRAIDAMSSGQDATDNQLAQLKMPVLLVWGSVDQITPPSLGETMHRLIPQSQLEMIPGCGHLAPGQCADQIGPKVVAFLQR